MKKRTKIIALLMATIVGSSLLAGCGAGTDTKSGSSSDSEKTDSAKETSSDGDDQTLMIIYA